LLREGHDFGPVCGARRTSSGLARLRTPAAASPAFAADPPTLAVRGRPTPIDGGRRPPEAEPGSVTIRTEMQGEPTFSVVMPTVGRESLGMALVSAAKQLGPGDEIICICNNDGDMGSAARNSAMARARGSHLIFLDDDDVYTRGALKAMRDFARENPGRIGIFRLVNNDGSLLWATPELREGNMGSPILVVPNIPEKLGEWRQTDHGNDWNFIEATVALQGEPVFIDRVVSRLRPYGAFNSRLDRVRYKLRLGTRLKRARGRLP
jgi:glycosyltransferase involved in cell wall biosynthesis